MISTMSVEHIHDHHVPHRPNDALEAAEKHRCRDVYCLVGHVFIAFRSLTRAQNCEHRVRQSETHDIFDRKISVSEHDCTLERICLLNAVTSQVEDVRRSLVQENAQLGQRRVRGGRIQDPCAGFIKAFVDDADLFGRMWKVPSSAVVRCRLTDEKPSEIGARHRRPPRPQLSERRESRGV
jgi:hypothetical protein